MTKYTLKIDGMACGMCEAHINDVIRKALPDAKKVASSHKKGEATFVAENADIELLKSKIAETGYTVTAAASEAYVKKGLFGR